MLKPGIVSVTFRKLSPQAIVDLTAQAGQQVIEWGGDVHVPPTDAANAAAVGAMTRAAGLGVASYGSYFKAGYTAADTFAAEVEAAKALNAPNIRIWAGQKGSDEETDRALVASSIRDAAESCAKAGMTLSLELHRRTLTDTPDSALRLIDEVAHENLHLYWQPNQDMDTEYNVKCLRTLLPYITNLHVFAWKSSQKFPLADGESAWRQYIDIVRSTGRDHALLLEFVCDGTEEQYLRDAETLQSWLG